MYIGHALNNKVKCAQACFSCSALSSYTGAFYWNEDVASVVLTLFQSGLLLGLDEAAMNTLVATLQRNAASLSKSSKFAKLVMELCKSSHDQVLVRPPTRAKGSLTIWICLSSQP